MTPGMHRFEIKDEDVRKKLTVLNKWMYFCARRRLGLDLIYKFVCAYHSESKCFSFHMMPLNVNIKSDENSIFYIYDLNDKGMLQKTAKKAFKALFRRYSTLPSIEAMELELAIMGK